MIPFSEYRVGMYSASFRVREALRITDNNEARRMLQALENKAL